MASAPPPPPPAAPTAEATATTRILPRVWPTWLALLIPLAISMAIGQDVENNGAEYPEAVVLFVSVVPIIAAVQLVRLYVRRRRLWRDWIG